MSKQIRHPANRVVLDESARCRGSVITARLFGAALSSSVLALMGTNASVAAQQTGHETAAKDKASMSASVRSQQEDESDRLIFEFAAPVQHVVHKDGDQLIIWFDQRRQFDLDGIETRTDGHLRRVEAVGEDATRWVILHLAPESQHESVIGDDGRKLTITLASAEHQLQSSGDDAPAAKAQQRLTSPSDHLSDSWAPRKRPVAKTEDVAAEPKPLVSSDNGVTAKTPATPKAAAGPADQATSKVDVAAFKKRPDLPADAKPVKKARLDVAAPGQFEVDELALDRALERTLTREGAVLLPFGMVEIEPGISYVRREFDAPTLVNLFGFPAFGETVVRRNEVSATLAARVGLPLDSQLELDVPYRYVDQSATTTIGFNAIEETDDSAYAFGDIGVSLAKTLLREDRWWPDAVARIRWDSGTGKTAENGVALGGGTHELTGSVSLVKSQDPLAFFGTVAYEKTFEENDIDRGDRIGIAAGTVLAASPDTSLRVSIQQDFIGDAEVDGDDIPGSDQLAASLRLGASSVLGQGVLLDASVDVGLTDDAPDYAARLSLPIRFKPSGFFPFEDQDGGNGPEEDED